MSECIRIHLVKYEINENDTVKPLEIEELFEFIGNTLLSELLCRYAGDEYPICNHHIRFDRCLHYLIRDNRVEWLVPANECTIREYLDCFNEQVIELEMPTGIGSAVDVLLWIFKILDIAQKLDWVREKLKGRNLGNLFKSFQSKNGRYIEQADLKDFVISRSRWKLGDFMDLLKCYDMEIAESLLKYYGFEKVEPDIYVFNNEQMAANQEKFDNYDYQREILIENLLKENHL